MDSCSLQDMMDYQHAAQKVLRVLELGASSLHEVSRLTIFNVLASLWYKELGGSAYDCCII